MRAIKQHFIHIEPWNSLADSARESGHAAGTLHAGDKIASIHWSPDFKGSGQFWTEELVEVENDADVVRDNENEQVIVIEKSLTGDYKDAKVFSMHCCDCDDPVFFEDDMIEMARRLSSHVGIDTVRRLITELRGHRVAILVPS